MSPPANLTSAGVPAPVRMTGDQQLRLLLDSTPDCALLLLDPQGQITLWNRAAENLTGYRGDELASKPFSVFYPPDALQQGKPESDRQAAVETGHFEEESWRMRKDGSRFWAGIALNPLSENGQLVGFGLSLRDLGERKRGEDELRQFRILVKSVQDYAIYLLDPSGHVRSWNKGAERIKGYRADEVIGKHFSIFLTPEDRERGKAEKELQTASETGRFEDESWRVRKDGSKFWASVVITALRDDGGQVIGFAKITRDLSQRKQLDEEMEGRIQQRTEELQQANESLNQELAARRQAEEAIRALSTPVLPVRDRLLILPIIGIIDSARALQLTEQLLTSIRTYRATAVVMDITGVAVVDSRVANHLLQTVEAARLMGAVVIVTGISPEISQTLVRIGVDLSRLRTVGDLRGGLEEAEELLGYSVVLDANREGRIAGPRT